MYGIGHLNLLLVQMVYCANHESRKHGKVAGPTSAWQTKESGITKQRSQMKAFAELVFPQVKQRMIWGVTTKGSGSVELGKSPSLDSLMIMENLSVWMTL